MIAVIWSDVAQCIHASLVILRQFSSRSSNAKDKIKMLNFIINTSNGAVSGSDVIIFIASTIHRDGALCLFFLSAQCQIYKNREKSLKAELIRSLCKFSKWTSLCKQNTQFSWYIWIPFSGRRNKKRTFIINLEAAKKCHLFFGSNLNGNGTHTKKCITLLV